MDLVRMAVGRVRHLRPLTEQILPLTRRALVIGGGVAGIQSALDLADNATRWSWWKKPSIGESCWHSWTRLSHHGLFHLNSQAEDDGCRSTSQN